MGAFAIDSYIRPCKLVNFLFGLKQRRCAMMKEPINTLDKKFQVLSNRTRREILMRLNQESHSAGEIAGYFQITPASISYHLSLLQRSGLICCRQVEKRRIYSINRGSLDEVYLWLMGLYNAKSNK